MNYNEWLEERKKGIGGSDAASILGKNQWKSNVQLWEEKIGIKEAEDISQKEYVKYGKDAEKHLRELFKLDYPQYKIYHKEYEIIRHIKYPFLFASVDGILTEKDTKRKGILEIKTTNIFNHKQLEKWNNQIPDNYYIQVLHYLLVTGYEFVKIKAHLRSAYNSETYITQKHYHIERKEVKGDLNFLLEKEVYFWEENVLKNIKPELL